MPSAFTRHLTQSCLLVLITTFCATALWSDPIPGYQDIDGDGYADYIESHWLDSAAVKNPERYPQSGTSVLLGITEDYGSFQRFPQNDKVISIAAYGSNMIQLKADGTVDIWSSFNRESTEAKLTRGEWTGIHPSRWTGVVEVRANPAGLFGIRYNGQVYACAEGWAALGIVNESGIKDLDASENFLILLREKDNFDVLTPDDRYIPQLIDELGSAEHLINGSPIKKVRAGLNSLWALTENGYLIGAGDVDMPEEMDYDYTDGQVEDFIIAHDRHAGLALMSNTATKSWGPQRFACTKPDGVSVISNGFVDSFVALDTDDQYDRSACQEDFDYSYPIAPENWTYRDIASGENFVVGVLDCTMLDRIVADETNSDPEHLNEQDYEQVNTLGLYHVPIVDLSGFEKLTKLEALYISNVPVRDLSPLEYLPRLRELEVSNAPVADFSFLENRHLEYISISDTLFDELLEEEEAFPYLNLQARRLIQELEARGTSVNLSAVHRDDWWQVFDPAVNRHLAEALNFPSSLHIGDLANLSSSTLQFDNNPELPIVFKLDGLQYIAHLQSLDISTQSVTDISPLAQLKFLEDVNLADNPVADITPLLSLANLQQVDLDNTAFAEIIDNREDNALTQEMKRQVYQLESAGRTILYEFGRSARPDWQLHFSPELMRAIRDAANISTSFIRYDQLAAIYDLNLPYTSDSDPAEAQVIIEDLEGLQYLVNLETLTVKEHFIHDLTPLRFSKSLRELRISNRFFEFMRYDGQVLDLTPLISLPALENIDLRDSPVLDVPLELVRWPLQNLRLEQTYASELWGMPKENSLLDPHYHQLRRLASLCEERSISVGLNSGGSRQPSLYLFQPNLRWALLADVGFNDWEYSDLRYISQLALSQSGISDLSYLNALVGLNTIDLSENRITSLEGLGPNPNLQEINLSANPLANIDDLTLSNFPKLSQLNLNGTAASELAGLNKDSEFAYEAPVTAAHTRIISLEGAGISVDQAFDERTDWWTFFQPELTVVMHDPNSNELSDLPLSELTNVSGLYYYENNPNLIIQSLEGLQFAFRMDAISLGNQAIHDLLPLQNLTQLRTVEFNNDQRKQWPRNTIQDASPLAKISSLEHLNLSRTDLVDIRALGDLTYLEQFEIHETPVCEVIQLEEARSDFERDTIRTAQILSATGSPPTNPDWRRVLPPQVTDIIEPFFDIKIDYDQLASVANLDLTDSCITDLSFIQLMPNLQELTISHCPVSDLSALGGLRELTNLEARQLAAPPSGPLDASPLAGCRRLYDIELSGNLIADLEPFLSLPTLENLMLEYTFVRDSANFPHFTELRILENRGVNIVSGDELRDWSLLMDLRLACSLAAYAYDPNYPVTFDNMQGITKFQANALTSISGIEYLSQLEVLDLNENFISDISPLAHLDQLRELYLSGNSSPRAGFEDRQNPIQDLSPISNLLRLQDLGIIGQLPQELSWLSEMPSLRNLDCSQYGSQSPSWHARLLKHSVQVNFFEEDEIPAAALHPTLNRAFYDSGNDQLDADLNYAHLGERNITSLEGIENFTELKNLYLDGNQIRDISPLESLTKLTFLNLGANYVSDLSPLKSFTQLETLDVSENFISKSQQSPNFPIVGQLESYGADVFNDLERESCSELFRDPVLRRKYYDSHLSGLEVITNLEEALPIRDLTSVEFMLGLTDIKLSNAYVSSIAPIYNLQELDRILLGRYDDPFDTAPALKDIDLLANAKSLRDIKLDQQGISSLAAFDQLPFLEGLVIVGHRIPQYAIDAFDAEEHPFSSTIMNPQSGIYDPEIDTGLESALRDSLGISNNGSLDLHSRELTQLTAKGYGIEDLSGLEQTDGTLYNVDLAGNSISDFSTLSGISTLRSIILDNDSDLYPGQENTLSDLSAFSDLGILRTLSLRNQGLVDLAALRSMGSLLNLNLAGAMYDSREGSATMTLLDILEERGVKITTTDHYADGFTAGVAAVQNDPDNYSLYTRDQLKSLALPSPTIERQPEGNFFFRFGLWKSDNLDNWMPATGSLKQEDNVFTLDFTPGDNTEFYQIEVLPEVLE
ncbi:leucine-rich repeat domain-containing protein [Cerasicoccus maritimus]|uniref:leucine-rich repeat domain-containing protein n=1 Tax=Cerasicoccus maritimus TaxID=490089 RepID=UPI0028526963|nr:leucine-rich repeat domain-containing protein [Cerasicoccus maritimus]